MGAWGEGSGRLTERQSTHRRLADEALEEESAQEGLCAAISAYSEAVRKSAYAHSVE